MMTTTATTRRPAVLQADWPMTDDVGMHRRMRIAQSGSFVKKFTISDSAETPQISHRNAGAYISAQFMTIFCFKGLEKAPDIMGKEEISIFLKNSSISSFFIFSPKIQFLAKPW